MARGRPFVDCQAALTAARASELQEIKMHYGTVIAEDGAICHKRSPSLIAVLAWSRAFLRPQLVAAVGS